MTATKQRATASKPKQLVVAADNMNYFFFWLHLRRRHEGLGQTYISRYEHDLEHANRAVAAKLDHVHAKPRTSRNPSGKDKGMPLS